MKQVLRGLEECFGLERDALNAHKKRVKEVRRTGRRQPAEPTSYRTCRSNNFTRCPFSRQPIKRNYRYVVRVFFLTFE